jgi:hypothetical protein
MNLKDWEEKRDGLKELLRRTYFGTLEANDSWGKTATAALEFLGMKKPTEKVWCEHMKDQDVAEVTIHLLEQRHTRYCCSDVNFCPICGTPRPGTESKDQRHDSSIHFPGVRCPLCKPEPIELPQKFFEPTSNSTMIAINKLIDAVDQLSRRIK